MKKRAWDFHPDAQNEINAAADLYNEARPRIGDAFLDAIDDKLAMLSTIARPGTRLAGIKDEAVRRVFLLPRFPYALVLVVDVRVVLAVAHLRRRPNYWRARLQSVRPKKRTSRPGRGSAPRKRP